MPRKNKHGKFLRTVIGTLLSLLLVMILGACGEQAPPPTPVPEIRVVDVIQRDQPIYAELVGETRGALDVPIRARIEGEVLSVHFTEGQTVTKGALLYTVDALSYETKVVEAEGHLAEAQIRLAKNQADLERIKPLVAIGAASEADLDSANAQYEAALGGRRAAAARVEREKIQLGYTKIVAPISGRIGMTAAKAGEYIGRAPNPIVLSSISAVDPIRVRFYLDERNYLRLARERITEGDTDAASDEAAGARYELILADGSVHTHRGRLVATDARIDPDTGTFTLEAEFPNPDELVLAGQFARVRVEIDRQVGALLVPQRSMRETQGNFQVYVVDAGGIVTLRTVTPGERIGGRLQIIEKGVKPGERIAYEIARLEPGMKIIPIPLRLNPDGSVLEPGSEDTGS
jgi:membrane fusion protein (multidrug efflux system)